MKNKIKFKRIMFELKDLGIQTVYINFDGGGDDGDIQHIEYENDSTNRGLYDQVESISNKTEDKLRDWALELIHHYVDMQYGGDWVNNDGGYGNIAINVKEEKYNFNYSQRTTEDVGWEGEI